ncbi:MAG: AAA family ATPase [Clostridia bacterium]|nr:AAA family ATPase [Clostridia bacterium]
MIILEGIDGSGKTTLALELKKHGFKMHHFGYDDSSKSIEQKYLDVLKQNTDRMVMDRCFISELVYGPVLRGNCRLDKTQTINLLEQYKKVGTSIIYLKADKDDILSRRTEDKKDSEMLSKFYEELNDKYDTAMWIASKFLDVEEINTSNLSKKETIKRLERYVDVGFDFCR